MIQGIGAALLLPSSLKLALAYTDGSRHRARTVGLWSAGGGAGPLAGGIVLIYAGWRWVFLINTAVTALAIAVTLACTHRVPQITRKLDFAGQITATFAIAGVVFALVEGPHLGWSHPAVIIAVICFVAGTGAFVTIERAVAEPILPLKLARQPEFSASAALGLLFNFSFFGLLFALSLLLQDVKHQSALAAGLSFLPLTGVIVFGNLSAPRLAHRYSSNTVLFLGQALFGAGLVAVIFLGALDQLWPLLLALIPVGLGAGMLVPTMTSRLLESAPAQLAGAASGAFQVVRQAGQRGRSCRIRSRSRHRRGTHNRVPTVPGPSRGGSRNQRPGHRNRTAIPDTGSRGRPTR